MRSEISAGWRALSQEEAMSLTKPILGLAVGGALGLLKGLVAGITTGYVSQRVHSMLLGILAGIGIAAVLSLLVILRAGMALFWDIMVSGMLLGAIVGFATQRFGRKTEPAAVAR